ncbi:hypothetical protein [uncultured Flavobacterium sp.]|uniref:hypothetical protein n=1 Tax=uncultured Flavobacterium sp. TaxID=165435 RepID=UPI00262A6796|nr:hypothetical protein [uncultured Flavobacterium sp.]
MKIVINGYKVENNFHELYVNNWIDAKLIHNDFEYNFEFLTIDDLEFLLNWLKLIFEGNEVVKQFDFIDADIQFKVVSNQLNIILNNVNYTKSIFLNRKMIFILKKSIERELLKVPKRYIN